ncbi:MAG: hypothetical protein PHW77_05975 [Eubacteriales bacterium]|nr:hypothetical protein [Eubacteriales bacterium]
MNDKEREMFVFSEGRDPSEAEEALYEAFLPKGVIGRRGVAYNALKTPNRKIFGIFTSYIGYYRLASGVFTADDFHLYFLHVTKRSYFRPTDEIWTFDGTIDRPEIIKKYFNRYAPSLYSVFVGCRSFAVDIALAGCDTEGLAERGYFILPAGSKSISKLNGAVRGLRRCGIITSDDKIRIVSGEADIAILPKAVIPPPPAPSLLAIDESNDFDAGLLDAFAESVDAASPYAFPFGFDPPDKKPDNYTVYRLGYAAQLSRRRTVTPDRLKGRITDAAGLYVSFYPLTNDEQGISGVSADKILYAISLCLPGRSCVAVKYYGGNIRNDMFPGYTITNFKQADNLFGGAIILSEKPLNAIQIGRLEKKEKIPAEEAPQ